MRIEQINTSGLISSNSTSVKQKQQIKGQDQKRSVPEKLDIKQIDQEFDNALSNTRFSYSINKELNRFIVKIIDRDSDQVVREIPSKELQNLHENLKEAIGLFIDKMA